MQHSELLARYISSHLKSSRTVLIDEEVPSGEIRITKSRLRISPTFISPSTNLIDLAQRCREIEWKFDTEQERQHLRTIRDHESSILYHFKRLTKLNPERAASLLTRLNHGEEM